MFNVQSGFDVDVNAEGKELASTRESMEGWGTNKQEIMFGQIEYSKPLRDLSIFGVLVMVLELQCIITSFHAAAFFLLCMYSLTASCCGMRVT